MTAESTENGSSKKTFCIGANGYLLGDAIQRGEDDDYDVKNDWNELKITDGRFMEQIDTCYSIAYGVDSEGDIWEWGRHRWDYH